jgi:hypothetical protein
MISIETRTALEVVGVVLAGTAIAHLIARLLGVFGRNNISTTDFALATLPSVAFGLLLDFHLVAALPTALWVCACIAFLTPRGSEFQIWLMDRGIEKVITEKSALLEIAKAQLALASQLFSISLTAMLTLVAAMAVADFRDIHSKQIQSFTMLLGLMSVAILVTASVVSNRGHRLLQKATSPC